MRKVLFGIGTLAFLVLFTACHQADASAPTAAPTVTPVVTVAPTPTTTAKPTPTATMVPEKTANPNMQNVSFEDRMLELVNKARLDNNLEPLELSSSLCAAAAIRVDEYRQKIEAVNEIGYISVQISRDEAHSRLNGNGFSTVLDEIGVNDWKFSGENVTCNRQGDNAYIDATKGFGWWKTSPDHWDNILYENWTKTGIAVVYSNGIAYACQLFTTGHTEAPEYANPSPTVIP